MKICITGAGGQLGRSFQDLAGQYPGWIFHFAGRSDLDLSQPQALGRALDALRPDCLINCAAYTNVNQAQAEPHKARLVNVEAVAALARYCRQADIPLLHYSSDYVYHTERGIPYREEDATDPKGVYASTKLEGEQQAIDIHRRTTVIRTSWVYSPYGHNFVKTMLRLGAEKEEVQVVSDQIGTPTYATDLAAASLHMVARWQQGIIGADTLAGIFNYSNEGVCSWYDFALAIFELSGISCRVVPVASHEFPSPVQRPHFSVLDKSRIKQTFGLQIRHWRHALRTCLDKTGN